MAKNVEEYEISDYNYIGSALGNAYFSNVSFDELWSCVEMSSNREELDAAVESTIKLKEMTKKND